MNNNTFFSNQLFDQSTIRILYIKNKVYVFPSVVIIIAVSLFFFAVVPQIQNYFLLNKELQNSKERIIAIKSNVTLLSGVNVSDLDRKLQIVTSALPVDKDFAGILRVVSQAAASSNVNLGDFSFSVGNLSSETTKVANVLPIDISVTITGDISGTKRFLEELTRRFPLSEVSTLQISNKSSTIKITFYYKQLPQFVFDENQKFTPIASEGNAMFETLASFSVTP